MAFVQFTDILRRAQSVVGGRDYLISFPVINAGHQHSSAFQEGKIIPNITLLSAYREHGYSNKEKHAFQVREGDQKAVVLYLDDQDPSSPGLTDTQRNQKHGGHLGFGTNGREGVIALMDDTEVGPHIKIMCVYSTIVDQTWVRAEGRGHSGYDGQVFVFVEPAEKNNLVGKVQAILTNYELEE